MFNVVRIVFLANGAALYLQHLIVQLSFVVGECAMVRRSQ
jgi:hypothetical protein